MVEITDAARDKIKEALDQNAGKYLRIFVEGSGWGGPRLGMALDEPEENEKTVEINGLNVLIDDYVRPFTDGTKLDYVKRPGGEGFIMDSGSSCC